MSNNDTLFFWVDIETTGLDPDDDAILELAAIITDSNLKPLGKFHQVYAYHKEDALTDCNDFVREMHTENGLLDECQAALDRGEKPSWASNDTVLREFIKTHCGDVKPVPAGSTIHFDMSFIDTTLYGVKELLHYRRFDCRTLQTALEMWAGVQTFPKAGAHRAMPDIEETLAHAGRARNILANLRKSSFDGFR